MTHPIPAASSHLWYGGSASKQGAGTREKQLRYLIENEGRSPLRAIHPRVSPLRDEAVNEVIRLVEAYQSTGETLVHSIILLNRLIAKLFNKVPEPGTRLTLCQAAVGCFLVAIKFREVLHPCLHDMSEITEHSCEAIRAAEEFVVISLDWDISCETGEEILLVFC